MTPMPSNEKIDFDDLSLANVLLMIEKNHMSISQASHYHPNIYEIKEVIDSKKARILQLEGALRKIADGDVGCRYPNIETPWDFQKFAEEALTPTTPPPSEEK